jgi:hypothetical protein
MTRTAEATGLGPTALVAVEQHFPPGQRILVDELAGQMLPFGGRPRSMVEDAGASLRQFASPNALRDEAAVLDWPRDAHE